MDPRGMHKIRSVHVWKAFSYITLAFGADSSRRGNRSGVKEAWVIIGKLCPAGATKRYRRRIQSAMVWIAQSNIAQDYRDTLQSQKF